MVNAKTSRRRFLRDTAATAVTLALGRAAPRHLSAAPFVESIWSGALTATSVRVNAKIDHDSSTVRLHMSLKPDFSDPLVSTMALAETAVNNRMVSFSLAGLQPNSQYYYAIEADNALDTTTTGQLRTPHDGPGSFTFAFASCARQAEHPVFHTIRQHNPLFFIHMGDLHYSDINQNDGSLFRAAFDQVLMTPSQAALYRQVPLAYMWDDHDYGGNDSHKEAPSREAARLTYQEYVPHYPLAAGSGDVPIYQAFTIGRVRFIMTDTRSERDSKAMDPNDPNKSMMGVAQKAWFKEQLLAANGSYPIIIWVSTSPWLADTIWAGTDNWNGFRAERRELADFISENEIQGLFMISGDVHMLAIDDGSHNQYGSQNGPGFPIMQAAALSSTGTLLLGNSYSEGQYPGGGQFGLMTIEDDGTPALHIRWSGRNSIDEEVVTWEKSWGHRTYLPGIMAQ